MEVYGTLFWVGKGGWANVLVGLGWVGISRGEWGWGWVHCLIMPVNNTCSLEKFLYNTI